ncbi:hypothetical protein Trydic_g13414 [Trypoxylus dichotomus]
MSSSKCLNCPKSHNLKQDIEVRLLRCYVFSILYYRMEPSILTESTQKKHEVCEVELYKRILKISWVDRVISEAVFYMSKKRKLEYLGYIIRNKTKYKPLNSVLQSKMFRKRGPGRRRISWLKNLGGHGLQEQPQN